MKYCCECGGRVEERSAEQGVGERYVCTECKRSYFASPRLAAACVVEVDGKVLLSRRSSRPGYGLWNLPGGFLEMREAASRGAVRETLEEVGVEVEIQRPYAMFQIPAENVVQVVYLARHLGGTPAPGPESLEVGLFDEDSLPWGDLALTTTREVLRRYFSDCAAGEMGFLFAEIVRF